MTTTTATTESPPAARPGELTVRQRLSEPRPPLPDAVRRRITELHDRDVRTFVLADLKPAAECAGRPLSWVGDHLLVLEGVGILRPVARSCGRAWSVNPASEYLR